MTVVGIFSNIEIGALADGSDLGVGVVGEWCFVVDVSVFSAGDTDFELHILRCLHASPDIAAIAIACIYIQCVIGLALHVEVTGAVV